MELCGVAEEDSPTRIREPCLWSLAGTIEWMGEGNRKKTDDGQTSPH